MVSASSCLSAKAFTWHKSAGEWSALPACFAYSHLAMHQPAGLAASTDGLLAAEANTSPGLASLRVQSYSVMPALANVGSKQHRVTTTVNRNRATAKILLHRAGFFSRGVPDAAGMLPSHCLTSPRMLLHYSMEETVPSGLQLECSEHSKSDCEVGASLIALSLRLLHPLKAIKLYELFKDSQSRGCITSDMSIDLHW